VLYDTMSSPLYTKSNHAYKNVVKFSHSADRPLSRIACSRASNSLPASECAQRLHRIVIVGGFAIGASMCRYAMNSEDRLSCKRRGVAAVYCASTAGAVGTSACAAETCFSTALMCVFNAAYSKQVNKGEQRDDVRIGRVQHFAVRCRARFVG
jgi:hypothetical protein